MGNILMQFHKDGKGLVTLLRGVQQLHSDATVSEAGLEDGEELSLLWVKKYYETTRLQEYDILSAVMDPYKDLMEGFYVQIPDTVACIEAGAFRGCRSLVEVVIPNSVTSIETSAFDGCSSLTEVVIPDSVTRFGSDAFQGCSSLSQMHRARSISWLLQPDPSGDP